MLTYASAAGHAFIGHRLYLPARWTDDPARCRAAGVPAEVAFATKPGQAVELFGEAIEAEVPFGWVAMDGGYGQYATVRHWCRDRSLRYVLAVPCSLALVDVVGPDRGGATRPDELLAIVDERSWERRSCGEGAKGQRFYDWASFGVRVKGEDPASGFAHTLLIRRSISDPSEVAYFLVHAPQRTTMPAMVAVAGMRWKIEENNEQGKDLIGLDQYQVRTWTAWHHYVTVAMFAHAFLVVQRARLVSAHGQEPTTDQARKQTPHREKTTRCPRPPRQSQRAVARPDHRRRRPQSHRRHDPDRLPRPTTRPALVRLASDPQDPRPIKPLPPTRRPAALTPPPLGKITPARHGSMTKIRSCSTGWQPVSLATGGWRASHVVGWAETAAGVGRQRIRCLCAASDHGA
jgi:hypothetical protein